jgi:hypothetical protein
LREYIGIEPRDAVFNGRIGEFFLDDAGNALTLPFPGN